MLRANTSLPVPVSPINVTVTSARASGRSRSSTAHMAGETAVAPSAAPPSEGAASATTWGKLRSARRFATTAGERAPQNGFGLQTTAEIGPVGLGIESAYNKG